MRTDKAMEGDIVRACFDGSERRLLLASSLGEILVYRFLQVGAVRVRRQYVEGEWMACSKYCPTGLYTSVLVRRQGFGGCSKYCCTGFYRFY